MAHKMLETLKYTEWVYYDDAGEEVARDRQYDDYLVDEEGPFDLTDDDKEDFL